MAKTKARPVTKPARDGKAAASGERRNGPESVKNILSRQPEFGTPGMGPDACGRAVLALVDADRRLKAGFKGLKDERGKAQEKVIEELKKSGRTSVTVDGYTALIVHVEESDKVKLKAPRLNAED